MHIFGFLLFLFEVVMMEVHFKLRCQTSFANIYLNNVFGCN